MRNVSLLQAFRNIVLSLTHQAMGDPNSGNTWLQDIVILEGSGLSSYSHIPRSIGISLTRSARELSGNHVMT